MHIFAHRGSWGEAVENSKSSISKALSLGFSVETDMRQTKDNNIVIIHDSNTSKIFGVNKNVADCSLEELKQFDIIIPNNKFEKILTLRELLNILFKYYNPAKKQILALQMKSFEKNIEVKIINELDSFARENINFDIYNKVFVFDVTKSVAANIKKLNPLLRVAYSIGEDVLFPDSRYPTIYTAADLEKDGNCDYVWADEWHHKLYSYSFIEKMHSKGFLVFAVSPELHEDTQPKHPHATDFEKIVEDWKNLISWGIDGICTDYTNELAKMIKDEKN